MWPLCWAVPSPPGRGHTEGCPTATHKSLDKELPSVALRILLWEVAHGLHSFRSYTCLSLRGGLKDGLSSASSSLPSPSTRLSLGQPGWQVDLFKIPRLQWKGPPLAGSAHGRGCQGLPGKGVQGEQGSGPAARHPPRFTWTLVLAPSGHLTSNHCCGLGDFARIPPPVFPSCGVRALVPTLLQPPPLTHRRPRAATEAGRSLPAGPANAHRKCRDTADL